MATLTKTGKRTPLVTAPPSYTTHLNGQGRVFSIYLRGEDTETHRTRYFKLELNQQEAERLSAYIAEKAAETTDA